MGLKLLAYKTKMFKSRVLFINSWLNGKWIDLISLGMCRKAGNNYIKVNQFYSHCFVNILMSVFDVC